MTINVESIISWFKGKKTYFLALAAVAYGVGGYFTGNLDIKDAMEIVWAALTASALRAGINKIGE